MMKIYINQGNPYGLILQICIEAAGADNSIEYVPNEEHSGASSSEFAEHLPMMEADLGDGKRLFTSKAIVRYLLPNEEPK